MDASDSLPPPARYTPYSDGVFSVRPGLKSFGADFGNGAADRLAFQVDRRFSAYRAAQAAALTEAPGRYRAAAGLTAATARAAVDALAARLTAEHPALFVRHGAVLRCALTGAAIDLADPAPRATLDALAAEVQEDVALVALEDGSDRLAYVHVTAPNHWDPAAKAGLPFSAVHAPVPGMEDTNRRAQALLEGIARGAEYVRFVWGVTADDALDHHPARAAAYQRFAGKKTIAEGDVFVRVERQVLIGLPGANAVLFLIRTYIEPLAALSAEERTALVRGLDSMDEAARVYKGLGNQFDAVRAAVQGSSTHGK